MAGSGAIQTSSAKVCIGRRLDCAGQIVALGVVVAVVQGDLLNVFSKVSGHELGCGVSREERA
jgi:hypothetical protein